MRHFKWLVVYGYFMYLPVNVLCFAHLKCYVSHSQVFALILICIV